MIKQYKITVNGKVYDVSVEEMKNEQPAAVSATAAVKSAPAPAPTPTPPPAPKPAAPAIDENAVSVKATMPGTILSFSVAVGDQVSEGQVLVILEAMKMENEIVSPASGVVKSILVEKGSSVVEGQVILQIS